MTASNMSNSGNGIFNTFRAWISDSGQQLRKKHLFEQNTELLEKQGTEGKINKNGTLPRMESGVDYINAGKDDQMAVYGYTRSLWRSVVTWFFIVLTCGILRLFFHWTPHWWLYATHKRCGLKVAQKVLLVEEFQKKHKCYHVKVISTHTKNDIDGLQNNNDCAQGDSWDSQALKEIKQGNVPITLHTGGGTFKEVECLRAFRCKKIHYVWDWDKNEFQQLQGLDSGHGQLQGVSTATLHQQKGLSLQDQYMRRFVYGNNEIKIPLKSIPELLFLEVLNPFYVFQVCSFILWFLDNYYYYAIAILIMSIFGVSMSIIQTRRNLRNLRSTVHSSDVASVIRANTGEVVTVPTEHLVPGDLLVVPSRGCIMHCDAVLLTGTCIVNESMLTGESVPVTKTSLPNVQNVMFDQKEHSRHTLFCGTQVIQTRYFDKEKVIAVVIRTGFSTSKGNLVRSILYPPPVDFKFEHDSYKFVKLLAGLASLGFVYTIVTKVMRHVSPRDITLEALDLITVVVPPALPAAMTVGHMYAQNRLGKKDIYCITPRSINVSGSVDCVCFDKTGTLTEDGMDMWGVVPTRNNHFHIPVKEVETLPVDDELCRAMVSCHSLTIIDGKLSGDPLDLKMFESTNWLLEEPEIDDNSKFDLIFPTVVRPPSSNAADMAPLEIGIVRQFPFSSSLQRMSVITRVLGASKYTVYCKGSPEMIVSLSHPSSVPTEFHSVLEEYTQQGFRVLAVATKTLSGGYVKIQRMQREDVECALQFIGLVIMENRLKPETSGVIRELRSAHIRTIMVTGDNIQTAMSVARDCGMIPACRSIIVAHGVPAVAGQSAQVCFTQSQADTAITNGGGDASYMTNLTNSNSLQSLATIESGSVVFVEDTPTGSPNQYCNGDVKLDMSGKDFCFALTGRTWSIIKNHFPELIPRIVTRGAVFARMSPDQKQQLVQELQGIGYYVAMCGDGANDCGALKAAHTGISLSEAESSVASPFTSKQANISCVPTVIREGRAALVTSFGIFKYMAAYSLCQFVSVMILYSIDSNLTDLQYLYIDLFMITVFAFFFGRTEAFDGPLFKTPPLASLVSSSPVLSLLAQTAVVIAVQTASFYHIQQYDWFKPYDAATLKETTSGCFENYAVFATSSFQYIILAVVFSKGPPYRKPITSNIGMLASSVGTTALTAWLVLGPPAWVKEKFELVMPPDLNFSILMLVYAGANFVLAVIIETFLIDYLVFKKLRYKFHNIEKSHRKYLVVERGLSKDQSWPPLSQEPPSMDLAALKQPPRSPATITEICTELPTSHRESNQIHRQRLASVCGVTLNPIALMQVPKRRTISESEGGHDNKSPVENVLPNNETTGPSRSMVVSSNALTCERQLSWPPSHVNGTCKPLPLTPSGSLKEIATAQKKNQSDSNSIVLEMNSLPS
ncbi:hypothetical protein ONE63_001742 [Megalurothrips usitatus]|uniref:Cation-transporting ATPase n=1 Tax=Megalurothrips usitatus TaxID=439358 RepID=A0AAV7XDM6_9NEOP|nr:hypothetical protein ONE63_001742 [Megalurothrips usitatus]